MTLISLCWIRFWIVYSPIKDNMKVAERMMLEGDIREEFAEWMEEMKGTFIKPNSGAATTIEEVNDLEEIDFA